MIWSQSENFALIFVVLGGLVDCVNVNPSACTLLNHGLPDVQNVCALTQVGTVLNQRPLGIFLRLSSYCHHNSHCYHGLEFQMKHLFNGQEIDPEHWMRLNVRNI